MSFFSKLNFLFFHPRKFMESKEVAAENRYWPILWFFVLLYIISTIISIILGIIIIDETALQEFTALGFNESMYIIFLIGGSILSVALSFGLPFGGVAIIHLGILMFGGKQGYFNTFKPVVYASVIALIYGIIQNILGSIIKLSFSIPSNVESFIELDPTASIGLIIASIVGAAITITMLIHSLYAEIWGLSIFHKISKWKSFWGMIIIPLILAVIFLIFLIIIVLIAAAAIGSTLGDTTGQIISSLPF